MGGFDDEEQKHGEWKRYHTAGQLWDEGRFEHGKKKGSLEDLRRGGQAPERADVQVEQCRIRQISWQFWSAIWS